MPVEIAGHIMLDYAHAANDELLGNLSGVASAGQFLWTVSDEGRTVECLIRDGDAYRLHTQFALDDLIENIPGADDGDELDLESIDVSEGGLWLCGSHCNVRKKPKRKGQLNAVLRGRPSRHLLASIRVKDAGARPENAKALPFKGHGSLRRRLADDPYLAPFIDLPSKENGLDVEGFVVHGGSLYLGLRGPLIDSIAVVVTLNIDDNFAIECSALNFLDLHGLGVRDLARFGDELLVLAGPVSSAGGPFSSTAGIRGQPIQYRSQRPFSRGQNAPFTFPLSGGQHRSRRH